MRTVNIQLLLIFLLVAAKLAKSSLNQARNKLKNIKNSGTNLSVHDLYPHLNDFSPLILNNRRTFATE